MGKDIARLVGIIWLQVSLIMLLNEPFAPQSHKGNIKGNDIKTKGFGFP